MTEPLDDSGEHTAPTHRNDALKQKQAARQPESQQVTELAQAAERLIVALDFPSTELALAFVDQVAPPRTDLLWLKVGLELYLAAGEPLIQTLRDRGFQVFLDLKFHDIPNTVAGAVRSASRSGAALLTVHAAGGSAMMAAAVATAATIPNAPELLAVTVLTSMDAEALEAIGVSLAPGPQVSKLGRLAIAAGIHGLVCSAEEVARLRNELGRKVLLIVPGIRPDIAERTAFLIKDDQRRTATPREAIRAGASKLVIGRPITQAVDPAGMVTAMLQQIAEEMAVTET